MNDQLSALAATLAQFRQGHLGPSALAGQWRRAAREHQPALPVRYIEVLERVLTQLESSALFSEESCSFSQEDLLQGLQQWLDKARAQAA